MSVPVVAMPVSVEQITAAIQQMSVQERQRLLFLVPELRASAMQSLAPSVEQNPAWLEQLQTEVLAALGGQPLSPDEPFFGGLTVGEYLALTDKEQAALWDQWAGIDLMELEEQEVNSDAVFA
jgi:hypothetical protein